MILTKETHGRLEARITRPTTDRTKLYITINPLHPEGERYTRDFIFDGTDVTSRSRKANGFKRFIERVYRAGVEAGKCCDLNT